MSALRLASVFCDNMVLQQGIRNPVWGWAAPGEKVSVSLAGKTARGTARKDGRWQVKLAPLPPGGPYEMVVTGSYSQALKNVMVGEVWLASGQSNMQFTLSAGKDAETEARAANYPGIRMFNVANVASATPQPEVRGMWEVCSEGTVPRFSAVGYFFAREIHKRLGVPVGIINASWGGTVAEAWTSRKGFATHPAIRPILQRFRKGLRHYGRDLAAYQQMLKDETKCYPADPGNKGYAKGWADPKTATRDWDTMYMPGNWKTSGLDFNGVVWFRRDVDVPAEWAGKDLTLNLAPCDKHDTTYFNNVEVGGIGKENPDAWRTHRTYRIPGRLVRAGRNVIASRIYSYVYAGGFMGAPGEMRLDPPETMQGAVPIMLIGDWHYQIEHNFGRIDPISSQPPAGPDNQNAPCALYNGMISPLVPYGIRGAIWYQGESNASRAGEYRQLFPAMIDCWHQAWKQGDFPFLFVQLANYMAAADRPGSSQWAELREAQTLTLRMPNTGMAVAIDIGDAADIHPKNKQDVGRRLAAWALNATYGKDDVAPSGPLYAGMTREGSRVRIRFTHVDGGLVVKGGGRLTGFSMAKAERKFVWAEAVIEGDTVVVSSPEVSDPIAVRYAWADNPVCNLYNTAGHPASPFRTDEPSEA